MNRLPVPTLAPKEKYFQLHCDIKFGTQPITQCLGNILLSNTKQNPHIKAYRELTQLEYNKMKSDNIQENKIFLAIQYLDKSVFQVGFCSALAF